VKLIPPTLIGCIQLLSCPTILVAKVARKHHRRPHNVAYSGHTYQEDISLRNVPKWSPLYRKLQQRSTTPLRNSTPDTLHASSDSLWPTLTGLEPPPKEYGVLAAKPFEISPEIPGTPAAAFENIRREQDDHSDDVFHPLTNDDDVPVSKSQPPVKRRRRVQSASLSIRPGEVRTPLVINSRHDAKPYADPKHDEAMSNDHEWQAQRIVGERQASSGLEYEVSVRKTLWLPRAMLDTKLVRKYRAERRAATRVRTRWSSRLQKVGSSVRQRR